MAGTADAPRGRHKHQVQPQGLGPRPRRPGQPGGAGESWLRTLQGCTAAPHPAQRGTYFCLCTFSGGGSRSLRPVSLHTHWPLRCQGVSFSKSNLKKHSWALRQQAGEQTPSLCPRATSEVPLLTTEDVTGKLSGPSPCCVASGQTPSLSEPVSSSMNHVEVFCCGAGGLLVWSLELPTNLMAALSFPGSPCSWPGGPW